MPESKSGERRKVEFSYITDLSELGVTPEEFREDEGILDPKLNAHFSRAEEEFIVHEAKALSLPKTIIRRILKDFKEIG